MDTKITTVYSYPMGSYRVDILYFECVGGGICWEYRVLEGGIKRHESEDGYGFT